MNAVTHIGAPSARADEHPVLWQGRPCWRSAARRIFHIRIIASYCALMLAAAAASMFDGHTGTAQAAESTLKLLVISAIPLAGLLLLAWLTQRTTVYTITDRSLTLRFGIALHATLAIPFGAIAEFSLCLHPDHTGDLALQLKDGQRVPYQKLWPHARRWRFVRPEPMMRCVPQAAVVGALLSRALNAR